MLLQLNEKQTFQKDILLLVWMKTIKAEHRTTETKSHNKNKILIKIYIYLQLLWYFQQ